MSLSQILTYEIQINHYSYTHFMRIHVVVTPKVNHLCLLDPLDKMFLKKANKKI